ncbi:MAG: GNAT family N-acetyltransferase [Nitrospirae bacterium]|nr:GNAT family N-acetyltransferase [Nitrospirota bacterium]MBI3377191.1 GNAT family N-acetyltransferase [Nitrospirota bacterium]
MLSLENKIIIPKQYQKSAHSSICLYERDYVVKNLVFPEDIIKAYQLRHAVFCHELGWVPQSENGLELDNYDDHAVFFGVFDVQNRLLAHMRLITAENDFMIEKEFLSLVGTGHKIRKEPDTVELTRCCVTSKARTYKISTEFGSFDILSLLLKGIYHWCLKNDIEYVYAVTDYRVYRLVHIKGFPFKLTDKPHIMPDGVVAVGVIMNWREFEDINKVKRPETLKWFTQYQSVPVPWQQPQPAPWLQHQVFA